MITHNIRSHRIGSTFVALSLGIFGFYVFKRFWKIAFFPAITQTKKSLGQKNTMHPNAFLNMDSHSSCSTKTPSQYSAEFMQKISELYHCSRQRQCHIKFPDVLERKLTKMIEGGPNSLEVVSDFDRTLSKVTHNGKQVPTCHGVMECNVDFSEHAKLACDELRNKYYPIEIDPTMSEDEKVPFMYEWWGQAHAILVQERIHESTLRQLVASSDLILRTGVDIFFKRLSDYKVPVLIFSAGIGNVIDELLRYLNLYFENIKIVSNFMTFNHSGILVGFQNEIIHSFNKTMQSISRSEFYDEVCSKRSNVVLLGDSMGDVRMVQEDAERSDTVVIRIGFLNDKVDTLLPLYQDLYDVVLVGDETFDFANILLDSVIKCSSASSSVI